MSVLFIPQTKFVKKGGLKNQPSAEVLINLVFSEPLYKISPYFAVFKPFIGVYNGFDYNIFYLREPRKIYPTTPAPRNLILTYRNLRILRLRNFEI